MRVFHRDKANLLREEVNKRIKVQSQSKNIARGLRITSTSRAAVNESLLKTKILV
jgi:hypothetical protein